MRSFVRLNLTDYDMILLLNVQSNSEVPMLLYKDIFLKQLSTRDTAGEGKTVVKVIQSHDTSSASSRAYVCRGSFESLPTCETYSYRYTRFVSHPVLFTSSVKHRFHWVTLGSLSQFFYPGGTLEIIFRSQGTLA
jgi:hypothetical protein